MTLIPSNCKCFSRAVAWAVFGKKAWTKKRPAVMSEQNTMSSPLTVLGRLVPLGLAVAFSALAQGQSALSPQGGESALSGARPGDQTWPGLAVGADRGYAVWQDNTIDGAGWGIAARLLNTDGTPAGSVFQVNTAAAGDQQRPQVAMLRDGGAIFVWQGGRAGFQSVQARFVDASGGFLTGDVPVSQSFLAATNHSTVAWRVVRNNRTALRKFRVSQVIAPRRDFDSGPAVAALNNGNAVVAYGSYVRFTTNDPILTPQIKILGMQPVTNSVIVTATKALDKMQDVYLQVLTPAGARLAAEVRVNQTTVFNQQDPAIAVLNDGTFVVVWVTEQRQVLPTGRVAMQGSIMDALVNVPDIYARVFDAAGHPLTGEFVVSDGAASSSPSVAKLANGGFRVVWSQRAADRASGWDVFTRAFDVHGQATGAPLRVNTTTRGDQYAPHIASSSAGELVIWTSLGHDQLSWDDVFGQWITGGSFAGSEFRVNTVTDGRQLQGTVAASPAGRFLIGWSSLGVGTGLDVFGQRYLVP